MVTQHRQSVWPILVRGLRGKTPCCGKSSVLFRYLRVIDSCPNCHSTLSNIRAEDGPAWLTILVVGHLLAPVLLFAIPNTDWPDWVSMLVWPGITAILTLLILPRAKSSFIAILWWQQDNQTESSSIKNTQPPTDF